MHKYHFVSKSVAPKRVSAIPSSCTHTHARTHMHAHNMLARNSFLQAALEGANRSLEETKRALAKAKARLQEVEDGIALLQTRYQECVAKKEDLAEKCALCTARLERAEKVCVCVCVCACVRACECACCVIAGSHLSVCHALLPPPLTADWWTCR